MSCRLSAKHVGSLLPRRTLETLAEWPPIHWPPLMDPSQNAELAKNRAVAVAEVLKSAGVPEDRLVLQKPALTDAGSGREARRVEISAQ